MATPMTEEQYLVEQIRQLQLAYERDAKPYIERLVHLRSLEPSPRVVFDASKLSSEFFERLKERQK
jgi:hypothetical protein